MEKLKKCMFVLLLSSSVGNCIQIQPLWISRGQGHLVTLANILNNNLPPGKGGKSLYIWSRPHDQDGRSANIW